MLSNLSNNQIYNFVDYHYFVPFMDITRFSLQHIVVYFNKNHYIMYTN